MTEITVSAPVVEQPKVSMKPTTLPSLLALMALGGVSAPSRVALTEKQKVQLESLDAKGRRLGDRVCSDEHGVILFWLPSERKFAFLLKCQEAGCTEPVRVVRTSDIHMIDRCEKHTISARKARSKGRKGGEALATVPFDPASMIPGSPVVVPVVSVATESAPAEATAPEAVEPALTKKQRKEARREAAAQASV